jgi:NAD(P)-dependent dehydrogenase (short-subunit alcohol dehydrogenase family)
VRRPPIDSNAHRRKSRNNHRYQILNVGASAGFGADLARRLVLLNCKVVCADVNDSAGEDVVKELNSIKKNHAVYSHCDVTKKIDLQKLFTLAEKLGGADIMINNAGVGETHTFPEDEDENWKKVTAIDLDAVILGTRLAIEHFRKHGKRGSIVNVASMVWIT